MDLKRAILVISLLLIVASANAVLVTDSITTSGDIWTVPDGITKVDITVIGAGGSGCGGIFAYQNGYPTYFYVRAPGIGGKAGTKTVYQNVRVTPGAQYQVTVGMPGESYQGILYKYNSAGNYSAPPEGDVATYSGGTSSVTIDGVTYSAAGGHVGNYTVDTSTYPNGTPTISNVNNGYSGSLGYLISA